MDELIGLAVERLVQSQREAARRKLAAVRPAARQPAPRPMVAAPVAAPADSSPPAPPPSVAAPAPAAVAFSASPDAIFGGDSPFGPALFPTTAPAPPSARALLGAFAGGDAFLAGFVLAEALAPPLALREPRRT